MTAQADADATAEAPLDPLALARAWAGRVGQIAQHYQRREEEEPGFGSIEAHIHGAGRAQFEAAQMASFMATVSIAADLRRVADVLCKADTALSESGAIADARRTREHMARWADGKDTHPGEADES